MNNVIINPFSVANILSTLADIGFTVDDPSNGKAYWSYDTNEKIYVKVFVSGANSAIQFYKSNNTALGTAVTLTSNISAKISYEIIGESIMFGFSAEDNVSQKIQFLILEPETSNDSWIYHSIHNYDTNIVKFYSGATEASMNYEAFQLIQSSTSAIQLAKFYNGTNFYDNFYLTVMCTAIPIPTTTDTTGSNFLECTINNDTFIIINLCNSGPNFSKIAIKRPSSST